MNISMVAIFISIVSLIFTIVLIVCSFFKGKVDKNIYETKNIDYFTIFVFVLFAFLLIYKLGYYPKGLHADEAGAVADAINIAKYGTDRYLNSFPLYFVNFDGGQNALMTYLLAIEIKFFSLFGKNIFALSNIDLGIALIRIPAVAINFLAYVCFYKMIRLFNNKLEALLIISAFMFNPFSIMHSRFALESYLLFSLLTISSYLLLKAILNKSNYMFLASGIAFGITLYTYAISYFILPIFISIFGIYLLLNKKINYKNAICFAVPLFLLALPLIVIQVINIFDLNEITVGKITLTKLPYYRAGEVRFGNIIRNLRNGYIFKMMFVDDISYNSYKEFSSIFYMNIPLFFIGFYYVVLELKSKKSIINIYMIILLFSIFFTALLLQENNVNKINAIYLPMLYFISIGYVYLVNNSISAARIILILLAINILSFSILYYNDNQKHFITEYSYIKVLKEIEFINKGNEREVYIDEDSAVQPYIYILIYNDIDARKFNEFRSEGTNILFNNNYHYSIDNTYDDNGIYVSTYESYFRYNHYGELLERGFTTMLIDEFIIWVK